MDASRHRLRCTPLSPRALLALLLASPLVASATPPMLAYSPSPGGTVFVFVPEPGGFFQGTIQVTPFLGTGTTPADTTTLSNCQYTTNPNSNFSLRNFQTLQFTASSSSAIIELLCRGDGTNQQATLRCTEQRGTAAPVMRQWSAACSNNSSPPSLSYSPPPGNTLDFAGDGVPRTEIIDVTVAGGVGGGSSELDCSVTPGTATAFFTVTPSSQVFGPDAPPGQVTIGCNATSVARSAELTCVEDRNPGSNFTHRWDLECPATTCVTIPDADYVAPRNDTDGMTCATLPGAPGVVGTVAASLSLAHARAGDLTIKLVAPDGGDVGVALMDRPGSASGGAQAGLASTHWITIGTQGAASAEQLGASLGAGQVACRDDSSCRFVAHPGAEGGPSIGSLAGKPASGTWRLCVGDSVAGFEGSLCGTELDFPPAPVATLPVFELDEQIPPEQAPWYPDGGVPIVTANDRIASCGQYVRIGTASGAVIRSIGRPAGYTPAGMRCYDGDAQGFLLRRASSSGTTWLERITSSGESISEYGERIPASQCASAQPGQMASLESAAFTIDARIVALDGTCGRATVFDVATGSATLLASGIPDVYVRRVMTGEDGDILVARTGATNHDLVVDRYAQNGVLKGTRSFSFTAFLHDVARGNDGRYYVSLNDLEPGFAGFANETYLSYYSAIDAALAASGAPVVIDLTGIDYDQALVVGSTSSGELLARGVFSAFGIRKLASDGKTLDLFTAAPQPPYDAYVGGVVGVTADGTRLTAMDVGTILQEDVRVVPTRPDGTVLGSIPVSSDLPDSRVTHFAPAGPRAAWVLYDGGRWNDCFGATRLQRISLDTGRDAAIPIDPATLGCPMRLAYRESDGSLFVLSGFIRDGNRDQIRVQRYLAGVLQNDLTLPYEYAFPGVFDDPEDSQSARIDLDAQGNVFVLVPYFQPRVLQLSRNARSVVSDQPLPMPPGAFFAFGSAFNVGAGGLMATAVYAQTLPEGRVIFARFGSTTTQALPVGLFPGQMPRFPSANGDFLPDGRFFTYETLRNSVFAPRPAALAARAIVVAGGGPYIGNSLWDATEASAGQAYRALVYQGFGKETIRFLSPDPANDLDGNGANDDVDATASRATLQDAITGAFAADAEDLVLYLVDHGGPGNFRLNDTELVGAAALDGWLDQWQSAHPTGRVVVVVDACNSGGFVTALAGPNRVVVSSASPDEDARFLYNGALSFSALLFAQVQAGADVATAFAGAERVIVDTFPPGSSTAQTPWLDADGDGTPNEPSDRTAAQAYTIGNGIGAASTRPAIVATSAPSAISGTSTATLQVLGVAATRPIARVWAVLQPPALQLSQAATPLSDLPTVDLSETPTPGDYSVAFDGFDEAGTYLLSFFARDVDGRVSRPAQRTLTVQSPLTRKAVVAALGEAADARGPAFVAGADYAVIALTQQGYGPDGTVCTSSTCDEVFHVRPGVGGDATPTLANLQAALTTFAADGAQNAIVYLTGERAGDGLRVRNGEDLPVATLDAWLDTLQATLPGVLTVVVDADGSGDMIPFLRPPAGKRRVVIASTRAGERAIVASNGAESYSRVFWNAVANGASYNAAHTRARDVMYFADLTPRAQIDDNGDGVADQSLDGALARRLTAGPGLVLAGDPPFTTGAAIPAAPSNGTALVHLLGVRGTAPLQGATARVRSPAGVLRDYAMTNVGGDSWEATVDCLASETGAFQVQMHARDVNGALSAGRTGVIAGIAGAGACAAPDIGRLFGDGFE